MPNSRPCRAAWSRMYSVSASTRSRSSSSWRSPWAMPTESTVPATMMPMISTTTRISISVKPRCGRLGLLQIPVADVGIGLVSTGPLVLAQRVQVVFAAVRARILVVVGLAPWILAAGLEVAFFVVIDEIRVGGLLDQGFQALLGGRVGVVVELVEIECALERMDI